MPFIFTVIYLPSDELMPIVFSFSFLSVCLKAQQDGFKQVYGHNFSHLFPYCPNGHYKQ